MPTAMYLMLDRTTNGNEWSSIKTGVEAFANDAGMAGNQLALQYMPPAAGPGSCGGNGYDKPAVPLSVMPSGAGAIAASLAAVNNSGTTQLEGALSGGLDFCTSQAKQLTDHQVVFALLTDYTIFDSCGSTFTLPQIASAALGGSPPVYTWVLGFSGANMSTLSQLANAGGTQSAVPVGSQGSIHNALSRAAVGCRFAPPGGATVTGVTVAGQSLPKVSSAKACGNGSNAAGYYMVGSAVELCFASCEQVASSAPVQLVVTCP